MQSRATNLNRQVTDDKNAARVPVLLCRTNLSLKMKTSFQTIFEINSNSKTQASEVMRAKRSKDARLVEKFGKQKDSLAAEAPLQQPVCSSTTDDDKMAYTVADDDDDLKVRHLIYIYI